ncbi:MAG: cell division protein SepF [Nanoarchaeota archaeon]
MVFERFKKGWKKSSDDEQPDYIEIDLNQEKSTESKVIVKTFVLKTYDDINTILGALREGYTIVVIDIRLLKQKDVVELKRVISKIKKTVDAVEGTIVGFGENVVIAAPSFVKISKGNDDKPTREDKIERY